MNDKKSIIYAITNKKNGMTYVGSTTGTLEQAIFKHKYGFKNPNRTSIFDDVFHEEGKENFRYSILHTGLTVSERSSLRASLIAEYREAGLSYNVSKPTPAKRLKSVAQYSIDSQLIQLFESSKSASEALNMKIAGIKSCCFGTTLTLNGFIFVYPDDFNSEEALLEEVKRRSLRKKNFDKKREDAPKRKRNLLPSAKKSVAQFSLQGDLIETHDSCRKASEKLGILINSIKSCCYGNCKTLKGFIFIYPDDFATDEEILEEIHHRTTRKKKLH